MLTGECAVVSTLAGGVNGFNDGGAYADGSGTNAGFKTPYGVAVDASGNVFVADYGNQRIRKVTADGGTLIGLVALHPVPLDVHSFKPDRICAVVADR